MRTKLYGILSTCGLFAALCLIFFIRWGSFQETAESPSPAEELQMGPPLTNTTAFPIPLDLPSAEAKEKKKEILGILDRFYPPTKNSSHFWLSADLLYLLPSEDSVVLTNHQTNLFTTAEVTKKSTIDAPFEWDFGYRLGLGYVFSERLWDVALSWTHFHSNLHQKRDTDGNIGLGMFPVWALADDVLDSDWIAVAKMHWDLKLNLVDFDFGRSFSWNRFFLRPFLGLRAAWIDQDLDVNYGGGMFANGLNLSEMDSTFGYDRINMENDFFGIGPQLGIDPQFNLGKGWRIYTSACGTLNYGFFDVRQRETYLKTVRYHQHRFPHGFRWMLDASAGFLWRTFCFKKHCAVTLSFGWEYHLFFDQVEWRKDSFDLVSDNDNLSLNGVDVSFRLDF